MFRASQIVKESWKASENAVLCFIRDEGRILLIHKKTGLGAGLINAPGGRIEPGETAVQASVRETYEEIGLQLQEVDLKHCGDLYFQFIDGLTIRGYVFECRIWTGVPVETREAKPFWCAEADIPYENMWADDSWWMPHLLAGNRFCGRFIFDKAIMLSMCLETDSSDEKVGLPKRSDV